MLNTLTGGLFLLTVIQNPVIPPEQIHNVLQPSHAEDIVYMLPNKKFIVKNSTTVQIRVPFIDQYNDLPIERQAEIGYSACGPSALTMAFQYEGVDTSLIDVIDQLPSSVYVRGQMFYDLYSGTKIYGFKTHKIEQSPNGFYEALANGKPVIINVQNYNGIVGHAMVVVGIQGYNQQFNTAEELIIHDPYIGENRVFKYDTNNTLIQPEGFTNSIGILKPFYLE